MIETKYYSGGNEIAFYRVDPNGAVWITAIGVMQWMRHNITAAYIDWQEFQGWIYAIEPEAVIRRLGFEATNEKPADQ